MIASIAIGDTVSLTAVSIPSRLPGSGMHLSGNAIALRVRGTAFQRTKDGWLCSVGNKVYIATDTNTLAVTKSNGTVIRRID